MAVEFRDFTVVIPVGIAMNAPHTFDLSFPPRFVRRIIMRVPPGPRGMVGLGLASGGVQVYPQAGSPLLTPDDEPVVIEPDNAISSGAWQLLAYNIGQFQHTIQVRFELDPTAGQPASIPPAPAVQAPLQGTVIVGSSGTPIDTTPPTTTPFVPPSPVPTSASSFAVPATTGPPPVVPIDQ